MGRCGSGCECRVVAAAVHSSDATFSNATLEHAETLLRQRYGVKDYFPINIASRVPRFRHGRSERNEIHSVTLARQRGAS